ncbi:PREDICTED: anaphase-promoting complex subunit 7 [Ceratosolen solmsi marchali]|uniref:Anaphase-promoting complex subunit 7 n=1 Tax=Ceratosolen solmsi marchali TaxID=326594 RepID=A0AAJ6YG55_9HYME|nr:PREDICTED: anaphase-promoting complex subunit 7 [Ceratosolen solmsi marchali]
MTTLFDQIQHLYDQALYSNVISLANLVLSLSDHNNDLLPACTKFLVYVYCADSYFYLGKYRRAESLYKKSLQFRKCLIKTKSTTKPNQDGHKELASDVDVKYQIYACLIKLKNHQEALQVLQSIPGKQRTPKINMALAKMFQEHDMERSAIATYKEVLRECPLALEAAEGLLALGVKGIEVNSIIMSCNLNLQNFDWLNAWIKAHAHINNREYNHAVTTLRSLDNVNCLRDNYNLLVTMGECYYYSGDYKNALICLRRARIIEPDSTRGLDIYAAVLQRTHHVAELEKLISFISAMSECSTETYTAMAYALFALHKLNRANTIANQAIHMSSNNVEAIILRGNVLIEQKKFQEALHHFRQALQLKPHRYEAHKGLADCFVGMHRLREASNIASSAYKQLGPTPRVLTLYASILMKDPVTVGKAKNLLEKALSQEETYLPAVYYLAEIYEQEMNLEAAIDLLEKQADAQPTCKLHQMLGDLWARIHNAEKALDHYAIALNINPSDRRVLEGMHRLESTSNTMDSSSYYMAVGEEHTDPTYEVGEGLPDTDNDEAADESETEAVWSDMDLEANSQ